VQAREESKIDRIINRKETNRKQRKRILSK